MIMGIVDKVFWLVVNCFRIYKNGFVWHDLSEDDLIHPAHGNEYILKGSELFEESSSGRIGFLLFCSSFYLFYLWANTIMLS